MTGRHLAMRMLAGAAFVCLASGLVAADEIALRSGRTLRGYLFRGERESRVNTFGSSAGEMTLGVVPIRTLDIDTVDPFPVRDALLRALDELTSTDVKRRVELLHWALDKKDRVMAQRLAWEIRALADTNDLAKKTARGDLATFKQAKRLLLDPQAVLTASNVVRLETVETRRAAMASAASGPRKLALDAGLVERASAAFWRPRGVVADIPTRREEHEGGRYTLYVPEDLDPLEPRPLLFALHGGGIHLAKGTPVRGSGIELMPVFEELARRNRWFVCCPTALEAPWTANANLSWLRSVLEDVTTRWNVDLNRVHLFGWSGGGAGAWTFATRGGIDFASVGVAAGGVPSGVSAITGKKIPIWLYHGDEDEVFPVAPVRKAAEKLRKGSADFVYCELPREKHGIPPAALRDWIRYVEPKRTVRTKSLWPRASFERPLSKPALALWGDPAVDLATPLEDEDALARVRKGGFDAEVAARHLGAQAPSAALRKAVTDVLRDEKAPTDARRAAAMTIGQWGGEEAVNPLGDTLRRAKNLGVMAACARAVGRVGSQDSVEDLRWAVAALGKRARAIPGNRVPHASVEQVVRAALPVIEAIGRVKAPVDLLPELEEALVIGILQDRRPVVARAARGENPIATKALLAATLARTYRACGAEKTLFDMLYVSFRKNRPVIRQIAQAAREGWPPLGE